MNRNNLNNRACSYVGEIPLTYIQPALIPTLDRNASFCTGCYGVVYHFNDDNVICPKCCADYIEGKSK